MLRNYWSYDFNRIKLRVDLQILQSILKIRVNYWVLFDVCFLACSLTQSSTFLLL